MYKIKSVFSEVEINKSEIADLMMCTQCYRIHLAIKSGTCCSQMLRAIKEFIDPLNPLSTAFMTRFHTVNKMPLKTASIIPIDITSLAITSYGTL